MEILLACPWLLSSAVNRKQSNEILASKESLIEKRATARIAKAASGVGKCD